MSTQDIVTRLKVHRIVLMVIDHDGLGAEEVREVIESESYPNHCIYPVVKDIETREVAWSDDHPLNSHKTDDAAFRELFGPGREAAATITRQRELLGDWLRVLDYLRGYLTIAAIHGVTGTPEGRNLCVQTEAATKALLGSGAGEGAQR